MSPQDFRKHWEAAGDTLVAVQAGALGDIPLPDADRVFLLEAGLPEDAAPFLSFRSVGASRLQRVREVWRSNEVPPDCWLIGSNGSGDPLCLGPEGRVVALNHDNAFKPVLLNSSVRQLAETLLAYREVVTVTLLQSSSEDAFLEGRVPPDLQAWFQDRLRAIDPIAAHGPSLWTQEQETWKTSTA